jgi:hypothetical protein
MKKRNDRLTGMNRFGEQVVGTRQEQRAFRMFIGGFSHRGGYGIIRIW